MRGETGRKNRRIEESGRNRRKGKRKRTDKIDSKRVMGEREDKEEWKEEEEEDRGRKKEDTEKGRGERRGRERKSIGKERGYGSVVREN